MVEKQNKINKKNSSIVLRRNDKKVKCYSKSEGSKITRQPRAQHHHHFRSTINYCNQLDKHERELWSKPDHHHHIFRKISETFQKNIMQISSIWCFSIRLPFFGSQKIIQNKKKEYFIVHTSKPYPVLVTIWCEFSDGKISSLENEFHSSHSTLALSASETPLSKPYSKHRSNFFCRLHTNTQKHKHTTSPHIKSLTKSSF